jgi:hypothetical protein
LVRRVWAAALAGALALVALGLLLFAVPRRPIPEPPVVSCPGAQRLHAVVLPLASTAKGPFLLAVARAGGFAFWAMQKPTRFSPSQILYHWVTVWVCHPIRNGFVKAASVLVGPVATGEKVGEALSDLAASGPVTVTATSLPDGSRALVVNRALPPGIPFTVRLAVGGRVRDLSLRLLGVRFVGLTPESVFLLPDDLPAGRVAVEIVSPVDWQVVDTVHLPAPRAVAP